MRAKQYWAESPFKLAGGRSGPCSPPECHYFVGSHLGCLLGQTPVALEDFFTKRCEGRAAALSPARSGCGDTLGEPPVDAVEQHPSFLVGRPKVAGRSGLGKSPDGH